MKIFQIDSHSRKQVRDFIELPFRIYSDIPQWVPPLWLDMKHIFDFKRNPYYRHSEAVFLIAYRNNLPVGRLAVLNNKRYNDYNHSRTAFFYLLEIENDHECATGLFEAGCTWARERGLNLIFGPKGFTPLDGFGLLVKGFEHRPAFGLPYNPAYYVDLIEAQGFVKESEAVSGYLGADVKFPPRIHELAERIARRRGLRILHCNTRRDLRNLVSHLKELYNNSLVDSEGTVPLTDDEVNAMANQLIWLADPKLVKLVMKDNKAVGFLLAYPDISAALQKTQGRLFPFGWLTLLFELHHTQWININGAGLLPEYRGLGGTAILYSEMFKSVIGNTRYKHADIVQIGVENDNMQREMENFGIDFYKMHRTYKKHL